MTEIAVHTVLKLGREGDYESLHGTIPARLAVTLREAGVHDWRIWRAGVHLFHLIDVEDYQGMRRALADDPDNVIWQAQVNPLLDEPDDFSGDDAGITQVWSLAEQLQRSRPG
jgi:L-rhamnose mutarotase